eukprot:scaffold63644_cov46-Attheya_sp.AAC.3
MELSLLRAIFEPVKAHVDGFGAALFDSVIDDSGSTTVVDLEGRRGLGMTHIFKDDSKNDPFAGVVKTCTEFSFGGGGEDNVKDGAEDMDGSIHWWRNGGWTGWFAGIDGVAAEIEVASSATASFRFGKVGGVTMNFEAHVARNIANCGFWLGGAVIQEVSDGLGFGFCVGSGCQGSQSDEHGRIDGSAVVKESTDDFLDSGDSWGFKRTGIVSCCLDP